MALIMTASEPHGKGELAMLVVNDEAAAAVQNSDCEVARWRS